MNFILKQNKRNGTLPLSLISLSTFFNLSVSGQSTNLIIERGIDSTIPNTIKNFKHNNFGVTLESNIFSKGDIKTKTGNYHLYSKPHLSFNVGFTYTININKKMSVKSGLKFGLVKSNFYGDIPKNDLIQAGILRQDDSPPIVYFKEAYGKLSLSILMIRRLSVSETNFWDIRYGLNINYSDFSGDEQIGMSVIDTSNQRIKFFSSIFKSNNNYNPWVNIMIGGAKNFVLKNLNLLTISFLLELGTSKFLTSDYEITIPNKPMTTGTYSVKSSSLGLSIEYIFTGTNKRIVRSYQKKRL